MAFDIMNCTADLYNLAFDEKAQTYPIINNPIHYANWGLPKLERQMAIATVLEYPIWQRSFRSSRRGITPLTWRREAVIVYQNLIREEYLR